MGRNKEAERSLRKALQIEPDSAVVNFNLGLLLAEMGSLREAESALRKALATDPQSAAAAYNLGVLLASDRLEEAIHWCRKAWQLRPNEPKYAYTLAFYLRRGGDIQEAIVVLRRAAEQSVAYADVYALLGQIYEEHGRPEKAIAVYRQAEANEKLTKPQRRAFAARLRALSSR